MSDRIAQALQKLFQRHRVVFWYDTKQELRADFEALQLDGIEKIELQNNEFGVKYRILREAPQQKFLIYKDGPEPEDLDNWLLDVQLAQGQFRTDQIALLLADLELGLEFADVVEDHSEFYNAIKRKEALKHLLTEKDTPGSIRLKMLAVCAGAEPRLDSILENLLAELAEGQEEKIRLIERCALESILWQQMERSYGYQSQTPGLEDWVIELFKSCYAMETANKKRDDKDEDKKVRLTADALVFLKRWKDSRKFTESFEALSEKYATILNIEQDLSKRDFREVLEVDFFRLIDQKIISDLVRMVAERTVSSGDVTLWIRQRRQCHWYDKFQYLYEAIDMGAQFIQAMDDANLSMDSLEDGIQRYCKTWYRIDQLYRKFIFYVRKSGEISLMSTLMTQIENLYSNTYLLTLSDRWQGWVDQLSRWDAFPTPRQSSFYERWVQPFLKKEKKVCVIISDALRYEIGDELASLIRQEDRYEAKLEPALSMLPSYTQLGMAALLPHENLSLGGENQDKGEYKGVVQVDGFSSQGTLNRSKILERSGHRAKAIQAEDLLKLNRDESRTLFRENDVVYVYHNHIDKVGDNRDSEDRVFEAVEETCQELILLVKKLTNANASNLIVTADHGFLYQNQPLEESDFSGSEPKGDEILSQSRRYVIGKGLQAELGLLKFTSSQLGLTGDLEVLIPKSMNRLRLKGSGSRFVHGGATLQEVVIPVVRINKKRQSDISRVEVEILRGTTSTITAGQLAVIFYQSEPITDKVQPRFLRAGIYTQTGELISDSHELTFDLTSENPRERELPLRFVLTSRAEQANNQDVVLLLEERVNGTSHYQEYKSMLYRMQRSFMSDFDL